MASAKKIEETIVKVTGVQLTMTEAEAEVILAMCANVYGDVKKSRRGLTDTIYYALTNAGLKYELDDIGGEMHFLSEGSY